MAAISTAAAPVPAISSSRPVAPAARAARPSICHPCRNSHINATCISPTRRPHPHPAHSRSSASAQSPYPHDPRPALDAGAGRHTRAACQDLPSAMTRLSSPPGPPCICWVHISGAVRADPWAVRHTWISEFSSGQLTVPSLTSRAAWAAEGQPLGQRARKAAPATPAACGGQRSQPLLRRPGQREPEVPQFDPAMHRARARLPARKSARHGTRPITMQTPARHVRHVQ